MQQARERNLAGSDVIKNAAGYIYLDEMHTNFHAHKLYSDAKKIFLDSHLVRNCHEFLEYVKRMNVWWNERGHLGDLNVPSNPFMDYFIHNTFLENLKIASGFELAIKARLLQKGYVLYLIDDSDDRFKDLAKLQRNQPIHISEIKSITSYEYRGDGCYLDGFKSSSLSFSFIIKTKKYIDCIDLTQKELDTIDNFRELRNAIHLTISDFPNHKGIEKLEEHFLQFVLRFINDYVVIYGNNAAKAGSVHENFLLTPI